MLKRRDWLHVHGADGGKSDDSSADGSESDQSDQEESSDDHESDVSGNSDKQAEAASFRGSGDGSSEEDSELAADAGVPSTSGRPATAPQYRPPSYVKPGGDKDDSEDQEDGSDPADFSDRDSESGSSGDERLEFPGKAQKRRKVHDTTAEDVIRVWTGGSDEGRAFKGIALRCVMCKTMLLNSATYIAHVASKVHMGRLKSRSPYAEEAIQLASESKREDEETHAERLQRIKEELQSSKALAQKKTNRPATVAAAGAKRPPLSAATVVPTEQEDAGAAAPKAAAAPGATTPAGQAAGDAAVDAATNKKLKRTGKKRPHIAERTGSKHVTKKRMGKRQRAKLYTEGSAGLHTAEEGTAEDSQTPGFSPAARRGKRVAIAALPERGRKHSNGASKNECKIADGIPRPVPLHKGGPPLNQQRRLPASGAATAPSASFKASVGSVKVPAPGKMAANADAAVATAAAAKKKAKPVSLSRLPKRQKLQSA